MTGCSMLQQATKAELNAWATEGEEWPRDRELKKTGSHPSWLHRGEQNQVGQAELQ
jgi:hypothetical protein